MASIGALDFNNFSSDETLKRLKLKQTGDLATVQPSSIAAPALAMGHTPGQRIIPETPSVAPPERSLLNRVTLGAMQTPGDVKNFGDQADYTGTPSENQNIVPADPAPSISNTPGMRAVDAAPSIQTPVAAGNQGVDPKGFIKVGGKTINYGSNKGALTIVPTTPAPVDPAVADAARIGALQKEQDANRSQAQIYNGLSSNNTTWDLSGAQRMALAGGQFNAQQKANADNKTIAGQKSIAELGLAGHKYTADQALEGHRIDAAKALEIGKAKSSVDQGKQLLDHIGKYVSAGYTPEGAKYSATRDILLSQGKKPTEMTVEHTANWQPGIAGFKPGQFKVMIDDNNRDSYSQWNKMWNRFNKENTGKPNYLQGQRVMLDALGQIGGVDVEHLTPKARAKQEQEQIAGQGA